ncbi:MAG: hypothetical protein HOI59_01410 [Nitrospina sp.]|jgi:hypothetical protein|nr:hypothetical protein [Nitrospina sp.]MBT3415153.1 hypothetical protein [Nitrospina sp.]MBT3856285.1 hypothetical protein [Nitrospina sp.]MBT4104200.1 hypothetical protein [Nitrospina sp.]MBT4388142.1 hypothetical protein [Nitrospina sp.]
MEEANFPLDSSQTRSGLRALAEAREESSRPRRLEDNEDEVGGPEDRDDEEAERPGQAERTVIAEGRVEPRQNPTVADSVSEGQEVEIRDQTTVEEQEGVAEENLAPLEVARELGVDPRGGVPSPGERVTEAFESGNDVADPGRIEEVQRRSEPDSTSEGARRVRDEASTVERENPATPLREPPSIRDLEPDDSGESLDESFNSDPPSSTERSRADLQRDEAGATDTKVQQRVRDARETEERDRVRNEPALETPEQDVEPVEEPVQPLPGSGSRDESDATAVETERGQNVSDLI